jgi:hypothetical protein
VKRTRSPPPQSGQAISEDMGKAVGTPSGSMPLFQLSGSPSSNSEESDGPTKAQAISGHPRATQQKKDFLMNRPQLPPTSRNADLQSPSSGCLYTPPKGSILQKYSGQRKVKGRDEKENGCHNFGSFVDHLIKSLVHFWYVCTCFLLSLPRH